MLIAGRHCSLCAALLGVASATAWAAPPTRPAPGPAPAHPAPAPAPTGAPVESTLLPHLSFDRLTGMTKGGVTAIAQDSNGFLWFGAEEGLSRFDGYEFINYVADKNPENTLSNFTVNALAAGKDVLWIGTVKGLDKLDLTSGQFTHYHNDPKNPRSIASDYIVSLHIGQGGVLWIGTADAGVDRMDPATGDIRHYRALEGRADTLSDDGIAVVVEDVGGKLWVGAREAGLNLLDPATGKVVRYAHDADKPGSLSNDQVTSIFQDSAGTVWVGTVGGLNRFDASSRTFRHYLEDAENPNWITGAAEGVDGGLWLGVKGVGVYRLDRKSAAIEKYTHDASDPTSITHPWMRSVFSDRGGVLWFGFQAGGVSKLSPLRRAFTFYRTNPGLSFCEDGGKVWLGTQGRGIRALDLATGQVTSYLDEELSPTWTMKIVPAEKGALWLGTTDRGLIHFIPRTGQMEIYDTEGGVLASDSVFDIVPDGKYLWIGTFGAGLSRLDTEKKAVQRFSNATQSQTSLSSDFVVALHQDQQRPEILWIGTSAGLNELDKRTGRITRYLHDATKPTSISHDHITYIYEDAKGRMWITTWGGGLDLLDRQTHTFKAYRTSSGLASDVLYGIMEEKSGALWLTSNDGLSRFDPQKESAVSYHTNDGLQDDEFGQGGFYRGSTGRFYAGGPRGFNVFVPEDVKPDSYVPPIALTRFEILGEPRVVPTKVSLSFRDRWFAVGFSALAFASPMRNQYRYRLVGFHDWIETDRRFVSYSSLPPGNYTLEIIGSNAHGVWNTTGVRIPIHVEPPPWRTWWAYTSYSLALLLIGAVFVRRHRKQIDALRDAHRLSELEREMALTSAVQEGFFPPVTSVRDGEFRLEGFYRPASQCSGDWWWYEARGDTYLIVVGDVTGHGAGSAMVTAAAAACFRSLGDMVDDDLRLQAMNDEVLRVSRGQYHMTLTAVTINVTTGEFTIRSAGGVPVFSLRPRQRTKVHMCPGMPLGSPEFRGGRLDGRLVQGERLLIITDGIPEVALANSQLLGPRGVANFYMQTRNQELETALNDLIHKVEAVQASAQDDDWTAVMVQWGQAIQIEHDPDPLVSGHAPSSTPMYPH